MLPKISIITPSFNQGEFIRDTIESILAQNYPNLEHIVVDGGSTDNTVEILKSYNHLDWTSEPDNGQTDALNRGLAKATGDIVTWLNSDDWYPPNVLSRVAKEIENSPVVMGACAITDKVGKVDYHVTNVERTWFDLLKYWCSYSIPTQPSIFFSRKVLESIKRLDGTYLDEELYYCMDYDLWMRMWRQFPAKQIPELFSYYRMYEDNKTGKGNDPLLPEMSRIFNRACYAAYTVERDCSFILPLTKVTPDLEKTLTSLAQQKFANFEVVLVDYSGERSVGKEVRNLLGLKTGPIAPIASRLRYVRCAEKSYAAALNDGARAACSLYLTFINSGLECSPDFVEKMLAGFTNDRVGLIVPRGLMEQVRQSIIAPSGEVVADKIFTAEYAGPFFSIRKVALEDVGWFSHGELMALSCRALLANIINKGWLIDARTELNLQGKVDVSTEREYLKTKSDYINARVIADCVIELQQSPFAKIRQDHGYALRFPEQLIQEAQQVISKN